jgi:cation transport ATPase
MKRMKSVENGMKLRMQTVQSQLLLLHKCDILNLHTTQLNSHKLNNIKRKERNEKKRNRKNERRSFVSLVLIMKFSVSVSVSYFLFNSIQLIMNLIAESFLDLFVLCVCVMNPHENTTQDTN